MNVALPALVVFLILMPGFITRSSIRQREETSLDFSPFGKVVIEGVLFACFWHFVWLLISFFLFNKTLQVVTAFQLLSSSGSEQAIAFNSIARDIKWVVSYFASLLVASYVASLIYRHVIVRYRLDRIGKPLSVLFRFKNSDWYYLLTGADLEKGQNPDLIVVSAIVNVGGTPVLYTGILDNYFLDSSGSLDRLVLSSVMRRPWENDKPIDTDEPDLTEKNKAGQDRFYPIDSDYFVLRYSETTTLNVQYVKLEKDVPDDQ